MSRVSWGDRVERGSRDETEEVLSLGCCGHGGLAYAMLGSFGPYRHFWMSLRKLCIIVTPGAFNAAPRAVILRNILYSIEYSG